MTLTYRGGRAYLYRSERRGGRVTSRYVASGEAAVLMATLEGVERDEADFRRDSERQECKELDDLDGGLDELVKRAHALAAETLTGMGFHLHRRGQWRRRRVKRDRQGSDGRERDDRLSGEELCRVGGGQGRRGRDEGEAPPGA
jgi:hypothetical protein